MASAPFPSVPIEDVAIVGAGLAGLSAARALREAGLEPVIYDKGRGPGGRISTRRTDHGPFDHGAPFVQGRNRGAFAEAAQAWQDDGLARPWPAHAPVGEEISIAGRPGMNALLKRDADTFGAMFGTRVAPIVPDDEVGRGEGWLLRRENGDPLVRARWVLLAIPAPQAAEILGSTGSPLAAAAGRTPMAPAWSALFAFSAPLDLPDIIENRGPIGRAVRDSAKPDRAEGERWVVEASAAVSRDRLEDDEEAIAQTLHGALLEAHEGPAPKTLQASAHRWRYARRASGPTLADPACHLDTERKLGLCGDWLIGQYGGDAVNSGDALGRLVASMLQRS